MKPFKVFLVLLLLLLLSSTLYLVYLKKSPNDVVVNQAALCDYISIKKPCINSIKYIKKDDNDENIGIVSNAFTGGVSLPMQLIGSTFDGKMYNWDSNNFKVDGPAKFSIARLDGLPNGVTTITWGADRNDGLDLAKKTTVEQCTGFGIIKNQANIKDLTCVWETGVIYSTNKANLHSKTLPFIHIIKIDLDDNNEPYKMRMWEALIDDEFKSLLYTEQLKNNISAAVLFDDANASFSSYTKDKYISKKSMHDVQYMETFFDDSKGIQSASLKTYTDARAMFDYLKVYPVPK